MITIYIKGDLMYAFVILHYLSEEMTIECIDWIKKSCSLDSFKIIIVDNASGNGSGELLKKRYINDNSCDVIINEDNLGFAQGNNVGYKFAKNKYNPEYIIIMNNDVLIKDISFLKNVDKIYKETSFHVLGPNIISKLNGEHQNPLRLVGYTKAEMEKNKRNLEKYVSHFPSHYFYYFTLKSAKIGVKKILGKEIKTVVESKDYLQKRIYNPVLHGACYIFSKDFIYKEEFAFNPDTFLYYEEDILHYFCQKKGYTMIYDSSISVEHLEDVSTNMAITSPYKRLRMKYRNMLNSANVLLNLMNE